MMIYSPYNHASKMVNKFFLMAQVGERRLTKKRCGNIPSLGGGPYD